MALFTGHTITPDSALGGRIIEKAVRFNTTDQTEFYNNSLGTSMTGNRQICTISCWFKRINSSSGGMIEYGYGGFQNSAYGGGLKWDSSGRFFVTQEVSNSTIWKLATTRVFRDYLSWYHVVVAVDTTQATSSNRVKIYINGVQESDFSTASYPSQNYSSNNLGYNKCRIGASNGYSDARYYSGWNGYLAEYHFIDGQYLDSSYFGYTDPQTGIWRPKKVTGVTYGNNGHYLDFRDSTSTTTLGYDRSGNGLHFSNNNLSVSAGAGNDSFEDSPTNNFPTINPLHGTTTNVYDARGGNLDFDLSNSEFAICSVYLPTSGKWYAECVFTTIESGDVGVFNPDAIHRPDDELSFDGRWSGVRYGKANGTASIYTDNSAVQTGLTLITNNDIVGILADRDAGTISFTINGTAKGTPVLISTIYHQNLPLAFRAARTSSSGSNVVGSFNFGQRPFSHLPTGYKSLSSVSRATPSASGVIRPQRHFGVLSWSGNDSSQTIDGLEFTPDFVWIKARRSGEHHFFTDIIRGAGHRLQSSSQAIESDRSSEVTSFVRGGITIAGTHNEINGGGVNMIGMCWKAGGAAVANSDGSIASSISANQEAGFSIVTWTGNATSGATVGHGLGKVPACIFLKGRNFEDHWAVYHKGIGTSLSDSNRKLVKLNDEGVYQTSTGYWNDTSPTSSVFSLGNDQRTNKNEGTFVAYCWAEIPGYSAFGRYRGNGDSDGPYIHLGFRPAFIIYKKSDGGSDNWEMQNTTIDTINPVNESMYPNTSGAQSTGRNVDFLSNGFKIRNANGNTNEGRSYTYIYMAWAERPSGTMFGVDANAR